MDQSSRGLSTQPTRPAGDDSSDAGKERLQSELRGGYSVGDSRVEPPGPRLQLLIIVLTAAVAFWGFARAWQLYDRMILDESQVHGQVGLFLAGKFELLRWPGAEYPAAAMFPGFQSVLAGIAALTGEASPSMLRLYSFSLSLLFAFVVFRIVRETAGSEWALLRAAQAYLLPVVFPFHCLLYTDVFSLLVDLAAFWACQRRSYYMAGLLGLLALFVRQTNVIFIVFLFGYAHLEAHGFQFDSKRLWQQVKSCWPLLPGLAAFAAFVIMHGRVGLDHPGQQPAGISAGNLAISVALAGVLFFPLHLANVGRLATWIRRRWPLAALLVASATAVAFVYVPEHPWNKMDWLLRNQFMALLLDGTVRRLGFAALLTITGLSLLATPLLRPAAKMLYPFWFLSLVPIVLVEPRYHMPALLLFLLLRQPESRNVEIALWAWFAVLSAGLHHGMTAGHFVL